MKIQIQTRHHFEKDDFYGSGQMIVRNSAKLGTENTLFMLSVSYKIGWILQREGYKPARISLSDGMVVEFTDITALCDALNSDDLGFRPMTTEEIVSVMSLEGNRFSK